MLSVFSSLIINSIISASTIILMAVSFGLIFRVVHFFHFSHAIFFVIAPYFMFIFSKCLGIPFFVVFPLAIILCILLAYLINVFIYSPLKYRGSLSLVLLLASMGVYIALQNIISMFLGDETRSIRTGTVREGINFFGTRITPIQIVTICVSIALVIALSIFLKKTSIGKAMRAVASDPVLANVSGINSNRVILWTFVIGSALAGLAGILLALDIDMTPTMGMHALLMGIVAVIIGGVNSIGGIALGALLLATAQHFGAWYFGSQWQDAIVFIILVLFLLFKPEGFFGKKVKSATV